MVKVIEIKLNDPTQKYLIHLQSTGKWLSDKRAFASTV